MTRRALVLLLICASMPAADWKRAWRTSAATVAASFAVDAASSRGRYELNPVVGRGPFGARQVAVGAAITGGALAAQWLVLRRHPEMRRAFVVSNAAAAGAHGVAAWRNWR